MDAVTVSSLVQAFWPIVYCAGGLIFLLILWCVRLEARVLYNERDLSSSKTSTEKTSAAISSSLMTLQTSMNSMSLALGRLEGRMDGRNLQER